MAKTRRERNEILMALKGAVRKNTRFFVRGSLDKDETGEVPRWSSFATFEFFSSRRSDEESGPPIPVPGILGSGHNDDTEMRGEGYFRCPQYTGVYRPMSGSWSLWNDSVVRSAILSIPDDASVRFAVRLDSGTSPLAIEARLHVDKIILTAEWMRGSKTYMREFILDVMVCKHNSARFGGGADAKAVVVAA